MACATLGCAAASWCLISQVSNCCYNYPPGSFNVCIAAPAFRDSLRGRMDGYTLGARQPHSEAVADVDAQRNATTFAAAASQPYVQVVVESNPTATAPDAANQLLPCRCILRRLIAGPLLMQCCSGSNWTGLAMFRCHPNSKFFHSLHHINF
jgi:hypothetical protein